jgi:hypothetical protein
MTDPISVANLALSLIKTAGEQVNKLRERAQATKDLEIKEHVGNLYDTMNGVWEAYFVGNGKFGCEQVKEQVEVATWVCSSPSEAMRPIKLKNCGKELKVRRAVVHREPKRSDNG